MASLTHAQIDAQVTALRWLYAAYVEILRVTGKYDPDVLPAAPLPPASGDSLSLSRLYELLDEAHVGLRATGYPVPTTWQRAHPNDFVDVALEVWGAVRNVEGELLADKTEQQGGERRPYLLSDLLDDLRLDQHCRKNAAHFADVEGCKRREANFARQDVKRIATICTAREGDVTVDTLRKQCAIAAERSGKTLEEFLKLDLEKGIELFSPSGAPSGPPLPGFIQEIPDDTLRWNVGRAWRAVGTLIDCAVGWQEWIKDFNRYKEEVSESPGVSGPDCGAAQDWLDNARKAGTILADAGLRYAELFPEGVSSPAILEWFPERPTNPAVYARQSYSIPGGAALRLIDLSDRLRRLQEKIENSPQTMFAAIDNLPSAAKVDQGDVDGEAASSETSDDGAPFGFQPPDPRHSEDFTYVCWYKAEYHFTKTQSACVKVLWEAWQSKTPVLKEETILERAGSAGSRLRDVFDKGKHPAWGTMVAKAGKGRFKLQEPEKPQPPGKPQENPA